MQQDFQTRSEIVLYSIEKSCANRLHGVGAGKKVIAKLDFEEVQLKLDKSSAQMTESEEQNRIEVAHLNKKVTLFGPIEEFPIQTQKFFFRGYCGNLLYRVEEYKLAERGEYSRMKVRSADMRSSDKTLFKFEDQKFDMSSLMDFFFRRRMYKGRNEKRIGSDLVEYKRKEATSIVETYEWYATLNEEKKQKKDNSKWETHGKVVMTDAEAKKAASTA